MTPTSELADALNQTRLEGKAGKTENSKGSPSISIESLPSEILVSIFENLHTPELLKLACLSRSLYTPATACLYRQVVCTMPTCGSLRDVWSWTNEKTTVTYNVKKLIRTLQNKPKMADLVEGIIIYMDMERQFRPLLDMCKNLKVFHHREGLKYCIKYPQKLERVSCSINLAPVFGPSLRELRLVYDSNYTSMDKMEEIAHAMIDSHGHVNLKTLVIDNADPFYYGASYEFDDGNAANPAWYYFMDVFEYNDIKLNLTTLAIDGVVDELDLEVLRGAVDFEKLVTLELRINEESSCEEDGLHEEGEECPSVLETMTKETTLLENLHISYRNSCRICDREAILRCLEFSVPHQLKQLYIRYPQPKITAVAGWQESVLKSQSNLETFILEDDAMIHTESDTNDLEKLVKLPEFSDDRLHQMLRQMYRPVFVFTEISEPFTRPSMVEKMKKGLPRIKELMGRDRIYKNARKNLPKLKRYFIKDLRLDMEKDGVLVNGQTLRFCDYKGPSR